MTTSTSRWCHDRARLSHDYLKNQVLIAIACLVRVARRQAPEAGFLAEFLGQDVPEWERHRGAIADLLDRFPAEMSPAAGFDRPPLRDLPAEDRAWMRDVVHRDWWATRAAEARTAACRQALEACDRQWDRVALVLGRQPQPGADELCEAADGLYLRTCELSRAISQLHSPGGSGGC